VSERFEGENEESSKEDYWSAVVRGVRGCEAAVVSVYVQVELEGKMRFGLGTARKDFGAPQGGD
jgi:hypothetical protein